MSRRVFSALTVIAAVLATTVFIAAPAAHATALGPSDFIKANGNVLKTNSGSGSTINLRGTNIGGWLTQEDWMSPLGEFAADRTGWSATASSGTASRALDGSGTSSWSTGGNQNGGEWFRLDLGARTLFNRLELDNTATPGQYARGLTVEVSDDGAAWKNVASQPGTDGLTTVRFSPQVARYVRLTQTGSAATPWSFSEVNLLSDPVHHNGTSTATSSSSAYGTSPSLAIDGDVNTVWQTGTPQTPGQWLTVDLGKNIDMEKVLFDAGAAHSADYPRAWDVFLSSDNSTWTKMATGAGANRTVLADFHGVKNARYVKITSNVSSPQWWSVAEVAIYGGLELDRGGWTVSSSTGASPSAMLDGDPATRWTTGVAQSPGQSVTVDMGALVTMNNVSTDTAKNTTSEDDWARGYRLELSRDGSTWTSVATGTGTKKATSIVFPAQAARYFRLTQTGTTPNWWSIGELTAGLHADHYALTDTLTTRFGAATSQAITDTHLDTWFTTQDLDNIQALGMNYIRVPMGWTTFMNLDGSWKADPWSRIDWVIQQAKARGIYVMLDLHTVPGGGCPWASCGRTGPNPNSFWGTPAYQDQVDAIWKGIASRYKGEPAVAGYDIINEPLIDNAEDADDVAQKSALFNRLYQSIRAIDPDHTIVMEAFFGQNSITPPSTFGWTNVMYEYHPYDMTNGMDWNAQNQLVTNELNSLPATLSNPGIPMLMGEFSLYYHDDVWSRFLAGLNAASVSWSNWDYKVRGSAEDGFAYWGLYSGDANPVPVVNSDDPATIQAKLAKFGTSNFTRNDRLAATMTKYAGGSGSYNPVALSHAGWTATASSTAAGRSPANALDGANGIPWQSGQPMAGGEWFRIDMGSAQSVSLVTLQTTGSGDWDFARSFRLETSVDGATWTTATTGSGFGSKRSISITPTTARYLRITQTGTATQWWSIDDVTVLSSY